MPSPSGSQIPLHVLVWLDLYRLVEFVRLLNARRLFPWRLCVLITAGQV